MSDSLEDLRTTLGYKPLSRAWAKLEILFGLLVAGAGLLLSNWALCGPATGGGVLAGAGLCLFVLGGYLALAGHRSHLYQSNNELTAFLVRRLDEGGSHAPR